MGEPIFLKGFLKEYLWGGTKLREEFGYSIPSDKTGELWAVSGHSSGLSTVINGKYSGLNLDELWQNHPELFGHQPGSIFPLMTKIIDANDDLAVQVHPGDEYSKLHENQLGKTECWYIIDAEPGAEVFFGHNAQTKEELIAAIRNEDWEDLLCTRKVKKGDFFYVPSGTVHAIGKGILVLETQQSSDVTYRLFDFNRTDETGGFRELHIEKSIDVITVPHTEYKTDSLITEDSHQKLNLLVSNDYFTIYDWLIDGRVSSKNDSDYSIFSLLDGTGKIIINDIEYTIRKGDHFILPSTVSDFEIDGKVHIIVSHK